MSYRVSPKHAVLVTALIMLFVLLPVWVARAGYEPVSDSYLRLAYDITTDDQYLAYIGVNPDETANLFRIDLTTNEPVTLRGGSLMRGGDQLRIAPNQLKIYFSQGSEVVPTSNSASLYRVSINGGNSLQLASTYSRIDLQDAAETPDGRYLAFSAAKLNTQLLRPLVVDTQNDTVGNLLPPSGNGGADNSLFLATPDNTRFIYIYRTGNNDPAQLVSVPVTGGDLTVLSPDGARNVSDVVISPDEAYIYYFASFNDTFTDVQLYRTPLAGGPAESLSPTGNQGGHIRFSEDGTYVFFALKNGSTTAVYRLTLADMTRSSLYSTENNLVGEGELILPDTGNRIVVVDRVSADSPTVPIYSIAYNPIAEPLLLTDRFGFNSTAAPNAISDITLAPDGASLLFTEPSGSGYFLDRVPVNGSSGQIRLLPAPVAQSFQVSKEGEGAFLVLSDSANNLDQEIAYLPFSGGNPLRLYAEVEGTPLLRLTQPLTGTRELFETTFDSLTRFQVATLTPAIRFASRTSASVAEGASRSLTVEMLPVSTETLTFTYAVVSGTATLGDDFTLSPEVLVFVPGQITQSLTINALTDAVDEPLESVTLALTGEGASDPLTVTVPIADGVIPISDTPAAYAAASESGRYLVYRSTSTTGIALYSYDLRTRVTTLLHPSDGSLTDNGKVYISPDEQTVIYETNTDLRRVAIQGDTSSIISLRNGCESDVQFTSDSQYAVVLLRCGSGDDTIIRVNLPTYIAATVYRTPDILQLTLSPDETYLLYRKESGSESPASIGVLPLVANSTPTVFTAPVGNDISFADFTAGNTLTYIVKSGDQGTVYRVVLGENDATVIGTITVNGTFYALNDKRDALFFVVNTTIRRMALTNGVVTSLVTYVDQGESTYHFSQIYQVPESNRIVYVLQTDSCPVFGCSTTYAIHSVTLNGQDRAFTTTTTAPTVRVSADGQYLAHNSDSGALSASRIDGSVIDTHLDVPALTEGSFLLGTRRVYSEEGNALSVADVTGNYTETLFLDPGGQTLVTTEADDLLYFNDSAGLLYVTGDQLPKVAFTTSTALIQEGGNIGITVHLAATPLSPVTVDYRFTGGTVSPNDDITFTPGTLTFAPFEQTKTFYVAATLDGFNENVETAIFGLSSITGGRPGDITTFTLSIADRLYTRSLPLIQRQ